MSALISLMPATNDEQLLEKYQPGPWALLVVALLAVALYLLLRSLNKQLKKVNFDENKPLSPDTKSADDESSDGVSP